MTANEEPYWNPVEPPRAPPGLRELLREDAEQVWTLSFLLELPYTIRIEDARLLVSADAEAWESWTPDALGALAGMPPVPHGVRPTHSIEIKQAEILVGAPHQASKQTFPDWEAATRERRAEAGEDTEAEIDRQPRTVIRVSVFESAERVPDDAGDDMLEWTARRFDDAIELINQYLVILAAMHDEWHISSLSRIDLPRELPYTLRLDPGTPEGPHEVNGSMDIYTWFQDDLPPARPLEEIQEAIAVVREQQRGHLPFFNWIELYQSAEHHLGSGRYVQSVIAATTGIEVLINTLFRVVWALKEWDEQELHGIFEAGFKNQLEHHLPKMLDAQVDLKDETSPPGIWHRDCYLLRNDVVHEGRKPTPAEALDAKLATGAFSRWIGETMKADSATDDVKSFLQTREASA